MKLFQIPESINEVLSSIPEDGQLDADTQAKLDALQVDFKVKVQSYCWVIAKLEEEIPHIKERAAQIAAKARTHQSRIDWLKEQLRQAMLNLKVREIATDWYDVSLVRNGGKPKVTVDVEPETLPLALMTVVTTYVANKDAIIKAWESKQHLPDGVKVERGEHVSIK